MLMNKFLLVAGAGIDLDNSEKPLTKVNILGIVKSFCTQYNGHG